MTGKEADLERGVDDSILVVCSVLPCHADRHARSFADVTAGWLGGAGEARELVPAGPDCSLASVLGVAEGAAVQDKGGSRRTDGRTTGNVQGVRGRSAPSTAHRRRRRSALTLGITCVPNDTPLEFSGLAT